jgi:hypothetical protein
MKQKKLTWQEVTGSRSKVEFVTDEVTCPTCESYSVIEHMSGCKCDCCGQTWVTAVLRK